MLRGKLNQTLVGVGLMSLALFPLFTGCDSGDTGVTTETDTGGQFVADGGAGGRIEIVADDNLGVGQRKDFFVNLFDADGVGIPFVRVFCESENGIAITEPSSGGVAFENTGSDGSMSGELGGLAAGSFIIECRAPEGFNLVARKRIHVTGEAPDGFEGFPGAAGGNLGGGALVDDTPDADDDEGVIATGLTILDAGSSEGASQIDISRSLDCDADGTAEGGADIEPFFFNTYSITVTNNTPETVILRDIKFTIRDSGADGETSVQAINVAIEPGGEATFSGPFIEFSGNTKVFVGTGDVVEAGTWSIIATIRGVTEGGEDFSTDGRTTVTFGAVDNCPEVDVSLTTTTTTT